jgi:hypothetical protein
MRRLLRTLPALALFGLTVACTGPAAESHEEFNTVSERRPDPPKEEARADESQWGTVKGRVVYGEDGLPENKKIDLNNHKDSKHCLEKGPLFYEDWVVNPKNKGVRWVIVWLVPEGSGKLPIHPDLAEVKVKEVEIDQPCCKFEPHAVALRKGQVLVAKNSSPVPHNVDWKGIRQPGGNTTVPAGEKLVIDTMKVTDFPISISCGIHPWMKGWARVFDHPYYAVTDADGNFEIKKAPAGKCRIVVWQEAVGYRTENLKKGDPIEIKGGAATDLGKLEIKPKKE